MSFAKHGIADQSASLGKEVLVLSALGLFSKLLGFDLTQMQVLGAALSPTHVDLVPGFIGLALIYSFMAFCVARVEAVIDTQVDSTVIESRNRVIGTKPLMALSVFVFPFAVTVYSMPYVLGVFSIWLLWSDTLAVAQSIWTLAST